MKIFHSYVALFICIAGVYIGQHYYFNAQERKLQEEKDLLCQTLATKLKEKWGSAAAGLEKDCVVDKLNDFNEKMIRAIDAMEREQNKKAALWIKEEDERLKRELREWQEKERLKREFKQKHASLIYHIKRWECGENDYFCPKDSKGNFIAYECAAGVLTIGWGHTTTARMRTYISYDEAEDLLIADIQNAIKQIKRLNIDIFSFSEEMQVAIIGTVFNVGYGNFRSMKTVVKMLRDGVTNKQALIAAWMKERPTTVSRRPNRGLITRKIQEIKLIAQA